MKRCQKLSDGSQATVYIARMALTREVSTNGRVTQNHSGLKINRAMVATVETRKSSQDDMVDVLLCSMNSDLMTKVQSVHQI